MCICLNCKNINRCLQYYLIELQHNEKHLNPNPQFFPTSPIVKIKTIDNYSEIELEWDVFECLSFRENPGYWSKLML